MGTRRRSRDACALSLAGLIAACSTGRAGDADFSALTFGADDGVPMDDGSADEGDHGTKTGVPPDSGTSGGGDESTSDGDTKGDPQATGPGLPETTGPAAESSSSGAEDDSTTGEPDIEPSGDPMYAECDSDSNCDSGFCLTLLDEYGEEMGSYCSAACSNAALDCEDPVAGDPICVATEQGGAACWLTCTAGGTCPGSLQCYSGTEHDWCLP